VLYALGYLLTLPLKSRMPRGNPFLDMFVNTFVGTIGAIVVYSSIRSGLHTINTAFYLLAAIFIWEALKIPAQQKPLADVSEKRFNWGAIAAASFMMVVVFAYSTNLIYLGGVVPYVPSMGNDYIYYSQVAQNLSLTGVETWYVPEVSLMPSFEKLIPYHFFDLWAVSAIADVTGVLHAVVYDAIVQPLFLWMALLGFCALLYRKVSWFAMVPLAFFALFTCHFFIPYYNEIYYLSNVNYNIADLGGSVLSFKKLYQLLPFFVAFLLLLRHENILLSTIALLGVPLIYVGALPALVGGITLFYVAAMLLKLVDRKMALAGIGYMVIVVVYYFGFYNIFGGAIGQLRLSDLNLTDPSAWKTRFNIVPAFALVAALTLTLKDVYRFAADLEVSCDSENPGEQVLQMSDLRFADMRALYKEAVLQLL
jgi:hypothetical protein